MSGLSPSARKLALTAHIGTSVGWLGAVAGFLALSIAGAVSDGAQTVRAAYLAMEAVAWFVLVPLSLASLATGLIQSLGTKWGLFRHYWVVIKFGINVVATIVLLMYMQTLDYLAGEVSDFTLSGDAIRALRSPSPVLHAGVALLLLVTATALSVYKPRGITRSGQRKLQQGLSERSA